MNNHKQAQNSATRGSCCGWSGALAVLLLALVIASCSSASRELRFGYPRPGPGVVYVAEQLDGLEEWSRGAESRAYARVYTRAGEADEGQLMRITAQSVVLAPEAAADRGHERQIDKRNVLFMRVWW